MCTTQAFMTNCLTAAQFMRCTDVGNLVAECAPLEASELPASQQQSTRCTRFAQSLDRRVHHSSLHSQLPNSSTIQRLAQHTQIENIITDRAVRVYMEQPIPEHTVGSRNNLLQRIAIKRALAR